MSPGSSVLRVNASERQETEDAFTPVLPQSLNKVGELDPSENKLLLLL